MAMKLYGLPDTNYVEGPNPFLIPDPTSLHPYFKVRQMKPGEMVLLTVPQDSMKCYGMGIIGRKFAAALLHQIVQMMGFSR